MKLQPQFNINLFISRKNHFTTRMSKYNTVVIQWPSAIKSDEAKTCSSIKDSKLTHTIFLDHNYKQIT